MTKLTEKKEMPRIEMVFTGKMPNVKGKPTWWFCEITGGKLGKERGWTRSKGMVVPRIVGGVYSVELKPEESTEGKLTIYTGTLRYERPWGNEQERLNMQAKAQGIEDEEMERVARKKAEEDADELGKTLDKLAAAYSVLPFGQRWAFLLRVQYHIQRRGQSGMFRKEEE